MAVACANKSAVGNWSKLFPTELRTEVHSLIFVKKLFAVAVSYVLYTRHLFPDAAFFDKQLEGVRLKIIKEDNKFPGSSKVVYWLRGCFDAIDRKFLKTATITLFVKNADASDENPYVDCEVVESYTFRVSYNGSAVDLDISTKDKESFLTKTNNGNFSQKDIQEATLNLLKAIDSVGKKLHGFSENLHMTMKLQYQDGTPTNYTPPGFRMADDVDLQFDGQPLNIRIGSVQTAHHSIKMHIQTMKSAVQTSKQLSQSSGNSMDLSMNSLDISDKKSPSQVQQENNVVREELQLSKPDDLLQSNESDESYTVRCPCGVNKDDGVMILCDGCGMWQHAVCFRIVEEFDVPSSHICEHCSESNPELLNKGGITDTSLQGISEEERRSTCLFRRCVLLCTSVDSLSPALISKSLEVEYTVARGLYNRLVKEGVLKAPGAKRGEKLIDKSQLENVVYEKIFNDHGGKTSVSKEQFSAILSQNSAKLDGTSSIRRTPKRPVANNSYFSNSQLSLDDDSQSPVAKKRAKFRSIANTPVPCVK